MKVSASKPLKKHFFKPLFVGINSKMKRVIAIIFISCFLISCNNQVDSKNEIRTEQINVEQDSALTDLFIRHMNSKISEPFKVTDIDSLNFTSGGGESVNQNEYCDSLNSGFFGTYFLIDEDFSDEMRRPVGGTITIHADGKMIGWKSDDTTQTIWKIHLKSDVISVWDSIHVGLTRGEIVKFGQAHNGFCMKKGDFYYSCDFNNFSVVYYFKNDTLTELTVTRNCERKNKKN